MSGLVSFQRCTLAYHLFEVATSETSSHFTQSHCYSNDEGLEKSLLTDPWES